jgi:hypothetical protein
MKWAYFGAPDMFGNASIEYLGDSITADALANVDVLILGQPSGPLSPDEIQAIANWFAQGNKVLWVAADSDYGSGVQAQDVADSILEQLGYGNLRVDLCSVEDPSSNAGAGYRVVGHVVPDPDTPFAGIITQNFVNDGKVLYHGPGVVAWVDENGTWHPLNETSKPPLTYRIVVTSENGTIVENNDPAANAYLAGDTGVFTLLAAQIVPLDNGKQSVLIVSGESPYGDYEPTWSPLYHGVPLDGPQFVNNILHWAVMVAKYGVPEELFSISDPKGDDHGPGTYTYPTNPVFNQSGLFDLTGVDISKTSGSYIFSFHFANLGGNPWNGPNGFSLQIIEAYLDFKDGGNTSAIKLADNGPGSNVDLDPNHPWDLAFRATGWTKKLVLPNGTVTDDLDVFVNDNTINVVVPAKYIDKDLNVEGINFPRMAVLVGSQDGFGVDEWRDVQTEAAEWRIGGGDADAIIAGVAPRVMDLIVPSWYSPSQEDQLSSYNASAGTRAVVKMVPVVPVGYLTLTSDPAGATVTIDGVEVGQTPIEKLELPAGVHDVVLKLDGYKDEELSVSIQAGKTLEVPVTMSKLTGMLTITSEPSGATVIVDGQEVGTTPLEKYVLPIGTHEVIVKKDGYKEETFNVSIQAGKELSFNVELSPLQTTTTTTTVPKTTTSEKTTTSSTTSAGKSTTTTTSTSGGKGFCGPAAIVGLAIIPLLLRRRK